MILDTCDVPLQTPVVSGNGDDSPRQELNSDNISDPGAASGIRRAAQSVDRCLKDVH